MSDKTFYMILLGVVIIAISLIAIIVLRNHFQPYDDEYQPTTINRDLNMRQSQINVLNHYEQSNIRIPVEIIEDLQYMDLLDEQEIHKFIENQRLYWKLENTKKPFIR